VPSPAASRAPLRDHPRILGMSGIRDWLRGRCQQPAGDHTVAPRPARASPQPGGHGRAEERPQAERNVQRREAAPGGRLRPTIRRAPRLPRGQHSRVADARRHRGSGALDGGDGDRWVPRVRLGRARDSAIGRRAGGHAQCPGGARRRGLRQARGLRRDARRASRARGSARPDGDRPAAAREGGTDPVERRRTTDADADQRQVVGCRHGAVARRRSHRDMAASYANSW
jgi:hypothetical protein